MLQNYVSMAILIMFVTGLISSWPSKEKAHHDHQALLQTLARNITSLAAESIATGEVIVMCPISERFRCAMEWEKGIGRWSKTGQHIALIPALEKRNRLIYHGFRYSDRLVFEPNPGHVVNNGHFELITPEGSYTLVVNKWGGVSF